MKLLKKGDTIGLAATARFIESKDIYSFVKWIESKELKVKYADNIFEKYHQFAGNDKYRAASFQKLIEDEEVNAVWIVRGGYGTTRILEYLDWSKFIQNPKWIIGFSDITLIHLQLASWGIPSIHGDMPYRFDKVYLENFDFIYQILTTGKYEYHLNSTASSSFSLQGKIIGGNLSLVVHSIGNSWINWHNHNDYILFLEDLEEYYYHVDRMAFQLKHSGFFKNVKGIFLGSFSDMKDNTIPYGWNIEEIFQNVSKLPIIQYNAFGHTLHNLPLIHGSDINLYRHKNYLIISQNINT